MSAVGKNRQHFFILLLVLAPLSSGLDALFFLYDAGDFALAHVEHVFAFDEFLFEVLDFFLGGLKRELGGLEFHLLALHLLRVPGDLSFHLGQLHRVHDFIILILTILQ